MRHATPLKHFTNCSSPIYEQDLENARRPQLSQGPVPPPISSIFFSIRETRNKKGWRWPHERIQLQVFDSDVAVCACIEKLACTQMTREGLASLACTGKMPSMAIYSTLFPLSGAAPQSQSAVSSAVLAVSVTFVFNFLLRLFKIRGTIAPTHSPRQRHPRTRTKSTASLSTQLAPKSGLATIALPSPFLRPGQLRPTSPTRSNACGSSRYQLTVISCCSSSLLKIKDMNRHIPPAPKVPRTA